MRMNDVWNNGGMGMMFRAITLMRGAIAAAMVGSENERSESEEERRLDAEGRNMVNQMGIIGRDSWTNTYGRLPHFGP